MSGRFASVVVVAAALAVGAVPVAVGAGDSGREVLGELLRRVRQHGRAEVTFQRTVDDPLAGGHHTQRGRLALEPPDRVDIRFDPGGERIVVRTDGGEWIQPELGQVLTLGPERAALAQRWSRLLLVEKGANLTVKRVAAGRYLVVAPGTYGDAPDSAWVGIGASGLPQRLEIREEGETATQYRFSGWHFSRSRGRAAFVIDPPPGYEVVRLP